MTRKNNRHAFPEKEKEGLYRAIFKRRDIRKEFLSRKIPKKILMKILNAAHHAGSVGFMQPWNFIILKERKVKKKVKEIFLRENKKALANYNGKRRNLYGSLKLEGIEESPVNICITCNPKRGGRHVLGRNTVKETDIFSTCCAIQNLWLAARAEGLGVGWVSIMNNDLLKKTLNIPKHIKIIAYLCVGYVRRFPEKPMLETQQWARRRDLADLVFWNQWDAK